MERLDQQRIDERLQSFSEWSQNGDTLQRTFRFEDFGAAMSFVNRIADLAERLQHHPDIMVRYDKVTLSLTTHDAGGVTDKDFQFAEAADGCLAAA